ncbi:uncharacterized protein LOC113235021 [Hyposmocoma kahamanoa]|uniref:uncharacterized protein LOC113235021 n=1 Tax=Hyposmocoma kahamanoa TaxID=1477025 RepID=UPI000E6D7F0C|nr:uncharacterized protein LOC113235021 [Hyposmocoma kahamanoa]
MTKSATTQLSPLQLLVGIDATTPVLRSLVRDIALSNSNANREALVSLRRQRANELLAANQRRQNETVNEGRRPPRAYKVGGLAFVIKSSQRTGKFDSGMRGPYKVITVLPHDRYELELLSGSYGKRTQAASEYMVPWRGEWTPEACSAFFETDERPDETDYSPERQIAEHPPEEQADEDVSQSGTAVLAGSSGGGT